MKHAFADRYETDDGPRIRCSRCGVGSHWPGAEDGCSGYVTHEARTPAQVSAARRAASAKSNAERQAARLARQAAHFGNAE